MKTNKKLRSIALASAALIIILILISSTASAATLKVGPNENYKTIQKAVNVSHEGDTIIVNSGTYHENVHITKDSLTILGKGYPKVDGFYNANIINDDYGYYDININGFSITKYGIDLSGKGSSGQIIRNNYFYSCNAIIDACGDMAGNNLIKNNNFTNGGIALIDSGADLIGNKIKNADIGIKLGQAAGGGSSATISKSIITGCNVGIEFYGSSGDIYDNYFNNKKNIVLDSPGYDDCWNTTKTPDYNIVLGPYIAGNFWGSPNGKGFSQTASDKNYDGIADSPYVINSENIDYLPLVAIKAPVASFKMSKSSGKVPLIVKFTDTSTGVNMTEKWSFGDGATSTLKNPSHKYTKIGKFKVTLTETNKIGSNSKSQYIKVIK